MLPPPAGSVNFNNIAVIKFILFCSIIKNLLSAGNHLFIWNVHFDAHCAAPWTLPPGVAATHHSSQLYPRLWNSWNCDLSFTPSNFMFRRNLHLLARRWMQQVLLNLWYVSMKYKVSCPRTITLHVFIASEVDSVLRDVYTEDPTYCAS